MAKNKKQVPALVKNVLSSTVVLAANVNEPKPKVVQFYTINLVHPEDCAPDGDRTQFLINVCTPDNQLLSTFTSRTYDHAVRSLGELLTKYIARFDVEQNVRVAIQQFSLRGESVLSDKTVVRLQSLEVGDNIKYVVSYAEDEHWPPHLNLPDRPCAFHETLKAAEDMYYDIIAADYIKVEHDANKDNPNTN